MSLTVSPKSLVASYQQDFSAGKCKDFRSFEEFMKHAEGTGLSDKQMTAFLSSREFTIKGKLNRIFNTNFVYVKVDDWFVEYYLPLIAKRGFILPPSFEHSSLRGSPIGANITAVNVAEAKLLREEQFQALTTQPEFTFKVTAFTSVVPDTWKQTAKMAIIGLECPELEVVRKSLYLTAKPNGHDFNIIVGIIKAPNSIVMERQDLEKQCIVTANLFKQTVAKIQSGTKKIRRQLAKLDAQLGTSFRLEASNPKIVLKLNLAQKLTQQYQGRCSFQDRYLEMTPECGGENPVADAVIRRNFIGAPLEKQLAIADTIDDSLPQFSLDVTGVAKEYACSLIPKRILEAELGAELAKRPEVEHFPETESQYIKTECDFISSHIQRTISDLPMLISDRPKFRDSLIQMNMALGIIIKLDDKVHAKLNLASMMMQDLHKRFPEHVQKPDYGHATTHSLRQAICRDIFIIEPLKQQLKASDVIDGTWGLFPKKVKNLVQEYACSITPEG
jgi:hypothetical protein